MTHSESGTLLKKTKLPCSGSYALGTFRVPFQNGKNEPLRCDFVRPFVCLSATVAIIYYVVSVAIRDLTIDMKSGIFVQNRSPTSLEFEIGIDWSQSEITIQYTD